MIDAAGSAAVVPGQKLEFVIKAPDNLMPVSTSQGVKLVSADAPYSDDEQETALAQEHRKVRLLFESDACLLYWWHLQCVCCIIVLQGYLTVSKNLVA